MPANGLGMLEGETQHSLAGSSRDKLNALHDPVNDDMFNAGILSFRVLSN